MNIKMTLLTAAAAIAFPAAMAGAQTNPPAAATPQPTTGAVTPPASDETPTPTTNNATEDAQDAAAQPAPATTPDPVNANAEPAITTTQAQATAPAPAAQAQTSAQAQAPAPAAAAGPTVLATAADITTGASVVDQAGGSVGTIESVDATGAVVATGSIRAKLPLTSFGRNNRGLVISMTRAQLEAAARQATPTPS